MPKKKKQSLDEAEAKSLRKKEYGLRLKSLIKLNYNTYTDYLNSNLWKEIKTGFLTKNPLCCLCGKLATQVHHENYSIEVLEGKDNNKLHALCRNCHFKIEFNSKVKLAPSQATIKLHALKTPKPKSKKARKNKMPYKEYKKYQKRLRGQLNLSLVGLSSLATINTSDKVG